MILIDDMTVNSSTFVMKLGGSLASDDLYLLDLRNGDAAA